MLSILLKMIDKNNVIKPETKIITIGKYKRCSTNSQDLLLQDESIDKHISRLIQDNPNIKYIIKDYEDFAVSGKTMQREGFISMMKDVEKNKLDIIIFTKLDRLARSLSDLLNITIKLEDNGVKMIVVEQNLDTTTYQGRLLFQIIGAFSEFERNIIRERMETGRKKADEFGSRSGKPCNRPKVKIDEDGVKRKFEKGMSMNYIAKYYNVSITPIRRILSNEIKEKQRNDFERIKKNYQNNF